MMAVGAFLFPPFRFGKGGGGGGGGGGGSRNYFGGFFLFACVLLLDYLKEAEKNLLRHGPGSGDQASIGLVQYITSFISATIS